MSILLLFIAGAVGSLSKDIVQDGSIKLPKKEKGELVLGFIGGIVTGGVAGCVIDGNPITAFLAGYAGTGAIEALLVKNNGETADKKKLNEQIIRKIAREQGIDEELAVRVAKCESSLDEKAKHTNADGSIDRGLFQINNKAHPEVSDEVAFNPIMATEFFCKAFKSGNISWWSATITCWEKK